MKHKIISGLIVGMMFLGINIGQGQGGQTNINPALLYFHANNLANQDQATRDYLFMKNNWAGRQLPPEFGEKIGQYQEAISYCRKAAEQKAPCDWGLDFEKGPGTMMAHYAMMKRLTQTVNLEVAWYLQNPSNNREDLAVKDILAMFAMGRHAGSDRLLISVLVEDAIEAIACSSVAGHYHEISDESLHKLMTGLDSLPPRVRTSDAIRGEKELCVEWHIKKIKELQKKHPGDDLAAIKEYLILVGGNNSDASPEELEAIKKNALKVDDYIHLYSEALPLYDQLAEIYQLPYEPYLVQLEAFKKEVEKYTNIMVKSTFPGMLQVRSKELLIETKIAMIRAAAAYRMGGKTAFEKVQDPCGKGPFKFERFSFNGVDRGFKVTGVLDYAKNPPALIFVEKPGPAFRVDGVHVGEAQVP